MELVEHMMHGVAALGRDDARSAILALQAHMEAMPEALPPEACPVKHVFAPGCYAREITMPAGLIVIGKIHRHAHVNVISKGRVRVLTEFGCEELQAPLTFVSEPGTKRVVHILEETVWTTLHITNSTDLAEIEAEIIAPDYNAIEYHSEATQVIGVQA